MYKKITNLKYDLMLDNGLLDCFWFIEGECSTLWFSRKSFNI